MKNKDKMGWPEAFALVGTSFAWALGIIGFFWMLKK
jgi:hypothetical protein